MCPAGTLELGGACAAAAWFLPAVIGPAALLAAATACALARRRARRADAAWAIDRAELQHEDPPVILGARKEAGGGFGSESPAAAHRAESPSVFKGVGRMGRGEMATVW